MCVSRSVFRARNRVALDGTQLTESIISGGHGAVRITKV